MSRIFTTTINSFSTHVWLLPLRVAAASFLMTHGYPKFEKLMEGGEIQFLDFLGLGTTTSMALAMFGEFICSIFIILGLGTRLAAIFPMVTMLVAALVAHADDPFQHKELPLLYFLIFTTLMIFGSGKYSIDRVIEKRLLMR